MKNSEKYKTAKARERAFEKFCVDIQKNNGYCFNCPAARIARKEKNNEVFFRMVRYGSKGEKEWEINLIYYYCC